MTITRPLRLMILHFSQIFLTEGRTFMNKTSFAPTAPLNDKYDSGSAFLRKQARVYLVRQVMRPLVRS